jgi:hypothetical protein
MLHAPEQHLSSDGPSRRKICTRISAPSTAANDQNGDFVRGPYGAGCNKKSAWEAGLQARASGPVAVAKKSLNEFGDRRIAWGEGSGLRVIEP